MNYYFLVASLPMLQLGAKPPIAMRSFLAACEENLAEGDLALLRDLLAGGGAESEHPFVREWHEQETELRNAVVRQRSLKLQRAPEPWLRPQEGFRVFIQVAVEEAFQAADPLEREQDLDRLRWSILEELAGPNPFGSEAIFSYGLRLRLAERWAAFDGAAGSRLLEQASEAAATAAGPASPP